MIARQTNILVLPWSDDLVVEGRGHIKSYHIKSHNILKRDVASPKALDKILVDNFRAAAGWKTKHKRLVFGRSERLDTACIQRLC